MYVVYDIVCWWFCFRNGWNGTACVLVIVNDILDHVDGIVAKVHKEQYGQIDDPMFGAFIDAFCDKVCALKDVQAIQKQHSEAFTHVLINDTAPVSSGKTNSRSNCLFRCLLVHNLTINHLSQSLPLNVTVHVSIPRL